MILSSGKSGVVASAPSERSSRSSSLAIDDRSSRARLGCKGPGAEAWLASFGLPPPAGPNRWHAVDGVQVMRLGLGEFLLAAADDAPNAANAGRTSGAATIARLAAALSAARPPGVYPVVREDVVVALTGAALPALLRQVCNVDFTPVQRDSTREAGPVILTSMIGVGVTALVDAASTLTLWLDPSYADYFLHTLHEVAAGDLT